MEYEYKFSYKYIPDFIKEERKGFIKKLFNRFEHGDGLWNERFDINQLNPETPTGEPIIWKNRYKLGLIAGENDYKSNVWYNYNQAKSLKYYVGKGQKSIKVDYYKKESANELYKQMIDDLKKIKNETQKLDDYRNVVLTANEQINIEKKVSFLLLGKEKVFEFQTTNLFNEMQLNKKNKILFDKAQQLNSINAKQVMQNFLNSNSLHLSIDNNKFGYNSVDNEIFFPSFSINDSIFYLTDLIKQIALSKLNLENDKDVEKNQLINNLKADFTTLFYYANIKINPDVNFVQPLEIAKLKEDFVKNPSLLDEILKEAHNIAYDMTKDFPILTIEKTTKKEEPINYKEYNEEKLNNDLQKIELPQNEDFPEKENFQTHEINNEVEIIDDTDLGIKIDLPSSNTERKEINLTVDSVVKDLMAKSKENKLNDEKIKETKEVKIIDNKNINKTNEEEIDLSIDDIIEGLEKVKSDNVDRYDVEVQKENNKLIDKVEKTIENNVKNVDMFETLEDRDKFIKQIEEKTVLKFELIEDFVTPQEFQSLIENTTKINRHKREVLRDTQQFINVNEKFLNSRIPDYVLEGHNYKFSNVDATIIDSYDGTLQEKVNSYVKEYEPQLIKAFMPEIKETLNEKIEEVFYSIPAFCDFYTRKNDVNYVQVLLKNYIINNGKINMENAILNKYNEFQKEQPQKEKNVQQIR